MWLAIAIAGGFGAICRFLLTNIIQKHIRSISLYATTLVNILGSFLLGICFGLSLLYPDKNMYLDVISTGFLGAFTTFSTFSYEAYTLYLNSRRKGVIFVIASIISATIFASLGILIVI